MTIDNEDIASEKPRDIDPDSDEELLKLAKLRFDLCVEFESANRDLELDDLKFVTGTQWPDSVKNDRVIDRRPCLTINKLPQFIRQITNDTRQNRPGIKVNPQNNTASEETAKIMEGIVRHIEYNSHADAAYDTALEAAATSGLGYWRIVTEYSDPMSFQQEILIKRIKDRMSVYMDPSYQEPDASDSIFGFVFSDYARDEFQAEWPEAKISSMSSWEGLGENTGLYVRKDQIRVCEYYYKVWEKCKIVKLSDGTVLEKEDLPKTLPEDLRVVSERETLVPRIKWAKITGFEVLERAGILGHYIPIVPVIGSEWIVDGKLIRSGLVRDAKDPQRMVNYFASSETEMIALAPKAPFIIAEGQIEGYEKFWNTANTKNHAYLPYKPTSIAGQQAPPPQRTSFEPQVQALTQAKQEFSQDLNATTGMYQDNLGSHSNAQAGVAIQRRVNQGQLSNFHYADNLARSLRHTGRILLNWIPQVYDSAQSVRIIGDDGSVSFQDINQIISQGKSLKDHFLDYGMYDCTVDTGPSYQTKRQEAVASMLDLARSVPQAMQNGLDILIRNMDWPGAKELAERLKIMLPPQVLQAEAAEKQNDIPPAVQQQMQQMGALIQQQHQIIAKGAELINQKKLELDSKERIEMAKLKNDIYVEWMKHNQTANTTIFEKNIEHIDRQLQMSGIDTPPQGPDPGAMDAAGMNPQGQVQPQGPGGMPAGPNGGM